MPTGLGPDSTTCTSAFIESMRAQMLATNADDPSIKNLDLPEVRKNFAPLGEAVYRIATEQARAASDGSSDAAFFQWIADVQGYLTAISKWQRGIVAAFESWAPVDAPSQALQLAVTGLADPGEAPEAGPTALAGRLE